jgi:alginate O-acetyltransferase complex protein AlgJ
MNAPRTETKLQRTLVVLTLVLLLASPGTTGIMQSSLAGFVPEADAPEFSLQSWLEGDFQRDADIWFKERFGLRDYYVRIANHLNYHFFSLSQKGSIQIIVGRDGELHEAGYLRHYCRYGLDESGWDVHKLFRRMRRLQDSFEARGIAFFFLITPTKASVYPDSLPDAFCGPQESPGVAYEMALDAMREDGVHYVDGFAHTRDAVAQRDDIRLFSKGGIHWNRLGAFYTTREILETADRLSSRDIPGIVLESVAIDRNPRGSDRDFADLLNLVSAPLGYEVPHPVIVPEHLPRRDLRAVFVGGSFLDLPMKLLAETEIFEQLDQYFYFDLILRRHSEGEEGPIERDEIDWEAEIFSADVVVLEANIALFASEYITKFLDDAMRHLDVE